MRKFMLNYKGILTIQKIIVISNWGLKAYRKNNEKVEGK